MAIATLAMPFVIPSLQAVYDAGPAGQGGQMVLDNTQGEFFVNGNAITAGNPVLRVQIASIDVLEFTTDGGFVRGPLIADGAISALREVRFTTDNTGNDWTFRPRRGAGPAIPSGPGLIRFASTIQSATSSTLNQLQLFPESQTFTASFDKIATMSGVTLTVDFVSGGFGAFIGLGATIEYAQTTSLFGAANVVRHAQRYQPQVGAGAITIGPVFTFVHIATISANGIAGVIHSQTRDFSSQPVYNGDGGTLTIGVSQQFLATMAVNAGATVTTRHAVRVDDGSGAGAIGTQRFFSATDCTRGTVENSVLWSDQPAGALNRMVRHLGTSQSDFGGPIAMGAGASTPDWILSHLVANIATLADGDSLRISTGNLFMGATGTVSLSAPVADRLDLATGDSFRIVSGAFEHLAGTVGLYGAGPVAQHSSTGQTAGFTAGVGTGVNDDSTFTGGTGAAAYTIGDVVRALKLIGIMAA